MRPSRTRSGREYLNKSVWNRVPSGHPTYSRLESLHCARCPRRVIGHNIIADATHTHVRARARAITARVHAAREQGDVTQCIYSRWLETIYRERAQVPLICIARMRIVRGRSAIRASKAFLRLDVRLTARRLLSRETFDIRLGWYRSEQPIYVEIKDGWINGLTATPYMRTFVALYFAARILQSNAMLLLTQLDQYWK